MRSDHHRQRENQAWAMYKLEKYLNEAKPWPHRFPITFPSPHQLERSTQAKRLRHQKVSLAATWGK